MITKEYEKINCKQNVKQETYDEIIKLYKDEKRLFDSLTLMFDTFYKIAELQSRRNDEGNTFIVVLTKIISLGVDDVDS